MNDPEIKVVLESILFVAEGPVTFKHYLNRLIQVGLRRYELRDLFAVRGIFGVSGGFDDGFQDRLGREWSVSDKIF